jgi:hypothetical protein
MSSNHHRYSIVRVSSAVVTLVEALEYVCFLDSNKVRAERFARGVLEEKARLLNPFDWCSVSKPPRAAFWLNHHGMNQGIIVGNSMVRQYEWSFTQVDCIDNIINATQSNHNCKVIGRELLIDGGDHKSRVK